MKALIALLLFTPTIQAKLPVRLDSAGRMVTSAPASEIALGSPFWIWEGTSSKVSITNDGELRLFFHIDIAASPYWVDLSIIQTYDGICVVGSCMSDAYPDVCESYASWDDLLKHQNQPLAEIAVDILQRCGMDPHWRPLETLPSPKPNS